MRFQRFLGWLCSRRIVWSAVDAASTGVNTFHQRCHRLQRAYLDAPSERYLELFADLLVQNGPFKGMRYPRFASAGSTLYPKLIGSYESELHPIIESLRSMPPELIWDIGCAEGYYAVGLARKFPSAEVHAFDIDAKARDLCAEMARINDVRVHIHGVCDRTQLQGLPAHLRTLVISDCEGFEVELFDRATANALSGSSVLIESHDLLRLDCTAKLVDAFDATHDITFIESVDDILKAYYYKYPTLSNLPLEDRFNLLAEKRGAIMRWLYLQPKRVRKTTSATSGTSSQVENRCKV